MIQETCRGIRDRLDAMSHMGDGGKHMQWALDHDVRCLRWMVRVLILNEDPEVAQF